MASSSSDQQFASAFEEQRGIRPRKFDEHLWFFPIAVIADRRIDGNPVTELQSSVLHHRTEERIELVCRLKFVHKKQSSAFSHQPSVKPEVHAIRSPCRFT